LKKIEINSRMGKSLEPRVLRAKTKWKSAAKSVRRIILMAVCLGIYLPTQTANCQQTTVFIDGNSKGRVFDGIGGVSAGASSRLLIDYPEPQRSQILDYLFKPGYGAALQHLKVEIGADVNSTDGSEPSHMRSPGDHNPARGYEWWLMCEAHKRNPSIVIEILPWGAPGWVGKDTLYTAKMAEYVVDFINTAKNEYSIDIAYTGVWNEKEFNMSYVKELHRQLLANHLTTRIICCDEYPGEGAGQWSIADDILKDPELAEAIQVIGVHYPLVDGKITTTDAARKTGKPLWSSEDQPNSGGGPIVSRDWPIGGRILAHLFNQNYVQGSLTSTDIWSPVTSYYDNLAAPHSGLMYANTPWSGHYDVQSTVWVTAHTTQFAQPGWQYLDNASGYLPGKGSYVTLRSTDQRNWSMIVETIGARSPQSVSFKIKGALAATQVHVWETNSTHIFEHLANLEPVNGNFEYKFEPESLYTLTTTTGQGKGIAEPPAAEAFSLPYSDDFETTPLEQTPKYLSDQDGAFEVRSCDGRPGHCLEQVISIKPIAWGPLPDPFTLTGDAGSSDYTVSTDVRFLTSSPAVVMGRIDSADVFQDGNARWPSGYILRIKPEGNWDLFSAEFRKPVVTLATGSVKLDRHQWHHLELRFKGVEIEASLDGIVITSIVSLAHSHGMFAIGTEWDHIQFDNLRVIP
jgi:hypothetical protein